MARAIWGPKDLYHTLPRHPSPKRGRFHSISPTATTPTRALTCVGIRRFAPVATRPSRTAAAGTTADRVVSTACVLLAPPSSQPGRDVPFRVALLSLN